MKIAIVGSGISGLTAAYHLRADHEITLFEANDYVGGHTNTRDVELDGERYAIDTGFIVFNTRTYPRFTELLGDLRVESRPTSMSFSVRCDRTRLEYNGTSLNGLFAQRGNLLRPSFHRILRDIWRFSRQAPSRFREGDVAEIAENITVREYLALERYSAEFAELYLLPMGAAIWSCGTDRFADFPMRFVVRFFENHGLLALQNRPVWRVVEGGSRAYVEAMLRRFGGRVDVKLRTPVQSVRRRASGVDVAFGGTSATYDHVVFACHADQALALLDDPRPLERELLGVFPYSRNFALLHTDSSVLPRSRRAWASWNYRIPAVRSERATVNYCMNILQHIDSPKTFVVTLNGESDVDPGKVLGHFVYEHPVFTVQRESAQARHHELVNANRTSFCGAYWRNGFHEDGVVSALSVCSALQSRPALVPEGGDWIESRDRRCACSARCDG